MLTASRPRADHEPTTAWTTACRPRAEPFSMPIRDQAQQVESGSRAGFKPDDEPITATNYTSSARSTADPELNGAPIRSWNWRAVRSHGRLLVVRRSRPAVPFARWQPSMAWQAVGGRPRRAGATRQGRGLWRAGATRQRTRDHPRRRSPFTPPGRRRGLAARAVLRRRAIACQPAWPRRRHQSTCNGPRRTACLPGCSARCASDVSWRAPPFAP